MANDTPETAGRAIVEGSIETVQEGAEGKTMNTFTKEVQADVQERTEAMQEASGDAVEKLVGAAMKTVEGYVQARNNIFDPNFRVRDTAKAGAAAWNDKGNGNEIAVDHEAVALDADLGYWERVAEHERVHRDEQAKSYNLSAIMYANKSGVERIVGITSLVEWQATQVNTAADLTAEYKQHKAAGEELAQVVGEGELVGALKSGDMAGLQEKIDAGRDAESPFAMAA
jgi:hypothetical protein